MKHSKELACQLVKRFYYSDPKHMRGKLDGLFCITHQEECCRCGIEWGQHGSDIKIEEYKKYISTSCAYCKRPIPGTWSWYMMRGNYCLTCPPKRKEEKKKKRKIKKIISAAQKRLVDMIRKKRK